MFTNENDKKKKDSSMDRDGVMQEFKVLIKVQPEVSFIEI